MSTFLQLVIVFGIIIIGLAILGKFIYEAGYHKGYDQAQDDTLGDLESIKKEG